MDESSHEPAPRFPQEDVTPADVVFGLPAPADVADIDEGIVLSPRRRMVDRASSLPSGSIFVLADYALGLKLLRTTGSGRISVTGHIHLELASEPLPPEGPVLCVPSIVALHERSGLALGRLSVDGRDVGVATARYQLIEPGEQGGPSVRAADVRTDDDISSELLGRGGAVDQMLGIECVSIDDDQAVFTVAADPSLGNLIGGLHGGVTGLILEQCASLAVARWAKAAPESVRPVELRAVFARPLAADGQQVTVRTVRTRLGRQTAITTTTMYSPAGKESIYGDALYLFER